MALTPEEMEEVKNELATRMGGQSDLIPGAKPKLLDAQAKPLGALGAAPAGGMGFGGIENAAGASPMADAFDPNAGPEKLLVDPAGMDAGAAAKNGFSSATSLAKALRKKPDGMPGEQVPETTPLPD